MWSEKKFAGIADRLIEEQDATVLLCGTKEETELVSSVVSAMRESGRREGAVRNLAGRTPGVAALAAVFSRSDLVIGNDSGPLHLAAATGVPSIAIYGSTSADFTGIRGEKAVNVWERYDCSPCFKRECPKEDYMACMDAVPVARIYNEAGALLGFVEPEFAHIEKAVGDTAGVKDRGG
jgi:ADP-heptose:LPS heptosyltransferase